MGLGRGGCGLGLQSMLRWLLDLVITFKFWWWLGFVRGGGGGGLGFGFCLGVW